MDLSDNKELTLTSDIEVNTTHLIANHVETRDEYGEPWTTIAEALRVRIGEIVMANIPNGSFQRPNVPLSQLETRLVHAVACSYHFETEDSHGLYVHPCMLPVIKEIAGKEMAYKSITPLL